MLKIVTKGPPQRKRKPNLGLAIFIIGLFLVGAALILFLPAPQEKTLDNSGYSPPPATASYAAPQLALTSLDGDPVSLDDYHGKVVLVNNWATWCPPCKAEMPELQHYYTTHASDGFVVVAIESGEPASTVSSFVLDQKLTFPVWLDLHGAAVEAFKNWDLPSSYGIDRDGIVRMSWTGPINQATLEKYITPLLEK